jgi:hypothetical protein
VLVKAGCLQCRVRNRGARPWGMLERLNTFGPRNKTDDVCSEKSLRPWEGYFFSVGTAHRVYLWLVTSLNKHTPCILVIRTCMFVLHMVLYNRKSVCIAVSHIYDLVETCYCTGVHICHIVVSQHHLHYSSGSISKSYCTFTCRASHEESILAAISSHPSSP